MNKINYKSRPSFVPPLSTTISSSSSFDWGFFWHPPPPLLPPPPVLPPPPAVPPAALPPPSFPSAPSSSSSSLLVLSSSSFSVRLRGDHCILFSFFRRRLALANHVDSWVKVIFVMMASMIFSPFVG